MIAENMDMVVDKFFGVLKDARSAFSSISSEPFISSFVYFAVIFSLTGFFSALDSGPLVALASGVISALLSPLVLAMVAISNILPHLIIKMLGGKGNFSMTMKASIYSTTPYLPFSVLTFLLSYSPLVFMSPLANIIAFVWSAYIYVIGLSELHKISTWKALAVVLVGWAITALVLVLLLLALGLVFSAGALMLMAAMMSNYNMTAANATLLANTTPVA